MADIVVNGNTSGAVTLSAPAVAGTVTVTLPATSGTMLTTASTTGISGSAISSGTVPEAYGGTGTSTGYYGFKNRIINGGMVVNQRGGTVTPGSGGTYGIDRFYGYANGGGVFTAVQSTDTPSGSGFSYSNLLTVTTPDSSIGATEYYSTGQFIEGYNVADLMWGTANAKTVTLSFWVKSSVTGSYSACLYNNAGDRCYPAAFTISVANTWQQVTLTVAGDTGGTWLTTNGIGLALRIDLGSGASFNGTANTWNTSGGFVGIRTSSNVNWIATNGATFYYTGVQLEKGSTATSFDYRPYGTELQLCQRYFETLTSVGGSSVYVNFLNGGANATTQARYVYNYQVQKRSYPSVTFTTASGFSTQKGDDSLTACTAITSEHLGINSCQVTTTVASGLTAGANSRLIANGVNTAVISCSAEL